MKKIVDDKLCCGCSACQNICPKKAIEMRDDESGFQHPVINQEKCINCMMCKKICPIINTKKIKDNQEAYSAYNINEEERKKSSSGGIFILIAKKIIDLGGVVFGAYFDEDMILKHGYVENKDELNKFQTSKYVQSKIGNMYSIARNFLNNGKLVFFTGTPCQIQGLKNFLKKDYENLYTQDIICHGVPSPLAWKKYIEYRKKIDNEKIIENVNFRNKENGWSNYNVIFKYKNKKYKEIYRNDWFMKAFLNNLIIRNSCTNCKFKKEYRSSDITLGDFWGINKIKKEMYDDKGTSLIIVNSKKGNKILKLIENEIKISSVPIEEAVRFNPSFNKPSKYNKKKRKFFKEINKKTDFDIIIKKFTFKEGIIKKIKNKIKNNIKKLYKK